ncbi:MAG: zinc metallopeptidase [Bacilli bacterium]
MYYWYDFTGYGLIIIGTIITIAAQLYVNSQLSKYKKVENKKNLSGLEVARKILDANGLEDIYVTETTGIFSDHYDSNRKVVRLSKDVFHGTSIASVAVAAHECGHAIQDKEGYIFIKLRGFIFPMVNIASNFGYIVIMIGLLFSINNLAWLGIGLLLFILLFQLITLPVEFNASARAKELLKTQSVLDDTELEGSGKMLRAAAFTYVASLATTLLEILRMVMIVSNHDD